MPFDNDWLKVPGRNSGRGSGVRHTPRRNHQSPNSVRTSVKSAANRLKDRFSFSTIALTALVCIVGFKFVAGHSDHVEPITVGEVDFVPPSQPRPVVSNDPASKRYDDFVAQQLRELNK